MKAANLFFGRSCDPGRPIQCLVLLLRYRHTPSYFLLEHRWCVLEPLSVNSDLQPLVLPVQVGWRGSGRTHAARTGNPRCRALFFVFWSASEPWRTLGIRQAAGCRLWRSDKPWQLIYGVWKILQTLILHKWISSGLSTVFGGDGVAVISIFFIPFLFIYLGFFFLNFVTLLNLCRVVAYNCLAITPEQWAEQSSWWKSHPNFLLPLSFLISYTSRAELKGLLFISFISVF